MPAGSSGEGPLSDQELREGLLLVAGEGRPSAELWPHLQERIAQERRRVWRLRLVGTAAGVLLFIGLLVGTPTAAWAGLRQFAQQVWSAMLGQTPASVIWVDAEKAKELAPDSPPGVETTQSTAQSFAGVAERAGFEPFRLAGREPTLVEVPTLAVNSIPGYESRMVVATYVVNGANYHLFTTGLFQRSSEGVPVLLPLAQLPMVSVGAGAPQGIRRIPVGETEAVCFEEVQAGAPRTRCTLLLEGLQVALTGPVPSQVEALLPSIGR